MLAFLRKRKTIEVDGEPVHLMVPTDLQMQMYFDGLTDSKGEPSKKGMRGQRARLIVLCVMDGDGPAASPMFTDGHLPEIQDWPFDVVKTIYETATELCGIKDQKKRRAAKKKNSKKTTGDDSSSSSPDSSAT